jgi:hypothetical protein
MYGRGGFSLEAELILNELMLEVAGASSRNIMILLDTEQGPVDVMSNTLNVLYN